MPPDAPAGRFALLWHLAAAVVVVIAAANSFVLSLQVQSPPSAALCGVAVWVVAYVVVSTRPGFVRWRRGRGVSAALAFVYGVRTLLGLLTLRPLVHLPLPRIAYVAVPDMWIGILALRLVGGPNRAEPGWLGFFVTTLLDGLLQQIPLAILFGVAYLIVRPFSRVPPEATRGFEVLGVTPEMTKP